MHAQRGADAREHAAPDDARGTVPARGRLHHHETVGIAGRGGLAGGGHAMSGAGAAGDDKQRVGSLGGW